MKSIVFFLVLLLGACNSGSVDAPASTATAPAGLNYRDVAVVYPTGQPIVPNTPTNSGGAISQYSVSPPLPDGISLDPKTGVMSGTPTTVTDATLYTVTGSNATGSATAGVQIEVKTQVIAPQTLSYPDNPVIYSVGAAIDANVPATSGGEITAWSISPALPDGLVLDPQTGTISGTPASVTAAAGYTVTASNSAGSLQTQISIAVAAVPAPPTSLAYSDPDVVYATNQAAPANTPQAAGGAITSYTVSPGLPAGLSLDAQSGVISGTPTTVQARTTYTVTGSNSDGSVTTQVAIAVASLPGWSPADSMNYERASATATLLQNGKVLVAGGTGSAAGIISADLYDPAADAWATTANMTYAHSLASAVLLPGGNVLVVAGSDGVAPATTGVDLYAPGTGTWTAAVSLHVARSHATATSLLSSKVLFAGGITTVTNSQGNVSPLPDNSAALYDPGTSKWTAIAHLNLARFDATATLLPNGQVLVAAGFGFGALLSSAELYDPGAGTWTPTASLSQARYRATATLLPNGKVLVAGGTALSGSLSSAELYDPGTGTWTTTGSMTTARTDATATLLPNGKVLVAGGQTTGNVALSSAELYDPATGTWTTTASMSAARYHATATLLKTGKVLVAGGQATGGAALSAAELYDPGSP